MRGLPVCCHSGVLDRSAPFVNPNPVPAPAASTTFIQNPLKEFVWLLEHALNPGGMYVFEDLDQPGPVPNALRGWTHHLTAAPSGDQVPCVGV